VKLKIEIDGKGYEVDVDVQEDHDPRFMRGYVPPYAPVECVTVPPPAMLQTAPANASVPSDDKVCRSPMAGIVVRVNVQIGQQIQFNDVLMVLEAMKMETNITAPVTGRVKSVDVSAGDAVQVNQVLVQFE
jgi:methylmalonyl-CoA carboxyltransferase 1.3S subunit